MPSLRRQLGSAALATVALVASAPLATAAEADASACSVSQWSASWGFKESFRAYLSGSIAGGEWITDGGVSYATPLFRIDGSSGSVSPDLSSGEVSATGEVRFIGHEGLLDQTLSKPRLVFGPDGAHLVVDVVGDTQEGVSVEARDVEFVSIDVSEAEVDSESGVWSVAGATTELTVAGAEAFGTYPAGEAFDPIDIELRAEPGCLNQPTSGVLFLGLGLGSLLTVSLAILAVRRWRGRARREPRES